MSRRRVYAILLGLAIGAFALRAGAIFALHRWTSPNAIEHRALALSLLNHHTFYFRDFNSYGPSSVQSPPYPILLATLFKLFGPESAGAYIAAMLLNSLAGTATVWLTYLMVRSFGGGDLVGLIAAALVAVWPSQVYAATHAQAIALITCGIVAMMYFFRRGIDTGRLGPWIGYAIAGCFTALTEPIVLPILALSGVYILFCRKLNREERLRNGAVLLAAAVLIIGPWTVRNRIVHGELMPIKSTFWVNLWKGNNPNATGTDRLEMSDDKKAAMKVTQIGQASEDVPHQYDALTPDQRAMLNRKSEADREKIFKVFAMSWIGSHPGAYLRLCVKRLGMTLLFDLDNPKARNLVWIISRVALLPLTVVGIFLAWRRHWRIGFALLVWASAVLTYSLTVTANRFAIPFEPLQLAFTALVLTRITSSV